MDISKLRKKHKEAQEKHGPEAPEAKPEGEGENEDSLSAVVEEEHPEIIPDKEARLEEEDLEAGDAIAAVASQAEKKEEIKEVSVPEVPEQAEEISELLVFKLSDELYAFRVAEVAEVLRPQRITSMPRTVDFIPGITSLRGKMIPVMDLKKRLHIDGPTEGFSNIVILKGAGRGLIGLLVDKTLDVIRVPEKEIMQPPSHLAESEAKFIEGVAAHEKNFISIIQPEELLDFNAGDI